MQRHLRFPFAVSIAAVLLVSATLPGITRAQCSYNFLVNDSPVSAPDPVSFDAFVGATGFWGAIGIRSASGSEHDLSTYLTTAGYPNCVFGQSATSATPGGVDVIVGDFRSGANPVGPWYAKVERTSGTGPALVEWDAGGDELLVDDDPVVHGTDGVLDVYQVSLVAGVSYAVDFQPSAGVAAKVLLFRNPAAASYWKGRSARLYEASGPGSYVAPATDLYAVVVVNEDGGLSTYSLAIRQCAPPIVLTSGSPLAGGPPLRYRMNQTEPYWAAVGVRGAGNEDWDLTASRTGRGNLEPVCFKDDVATSSLVGPGVDLVVGDFTYNPIAPFYARIQRMSGTQPALVEWDDGPDNLVVGATPSSRTTGPGDVLEIWDAYLNAFETYIIYFEHAGAADTRFFVFEDAIQSSTVPYWGARADAVGTGTTHTSYVPKVSGYHGVAVVNDNGAPGSYRVGVYLSSVGVGPGGGPGGASFDALTPNPAFGRTTLAFSLPRPAAVGFDVLDVSGRVVDRIPPRVRDAGPGREVWDARSAGLRVSPGIYFVRMNLENRAVGLRKLVLLP